MARVPTEPAQSGKILTGNDGASMSTSARSTAQELVKILQTEEKISRATRTQLDTASEIVKRRREENEQLRGALDNERASIEQNLSYLKIKIAQDKKSNRDVTAALEEQKKLRRQYRTLNNDIREEEEKYVKICKSELNLQMSSMTAEERKRFLTSKINSEREEELRLQQAKIDGLISEEQHEAALRKLRMESGVGVARQALDRNNRASDSRISSLPELRETIEEINRTFKTNREELEAQHREGLISDQEYENRKTDQDEEKKNRLSGILGGFFGGASGAGGGIGSIGSQLLGGAGNGGSGGGIAGAIGGIAGKASGVSDMMSSNPILLAIKAISGAVNAIRNKMNTFVEDVKKVYQENLGEVNARLYGDTSGRSFTTILESIDSTVNASPYLTQKELVENMVKFVESGVDYNIEQRALWATMSDKLVSTFDALDSTLLRMVRLQQADSTMSQMGLEAVLTKILNSTFKDTSYLGEGSSGGTYDSVYQALVDASSTFSTVDESTAFNYAVQKWLGALYSVGASEEVVTNIASAINSLATGDVTSLSENGTSTLLQLSATRAGLSYADILTNGITADETNDLMKSMIEYLRDIATNTSDNVVKSQWGDILGLEMSDWKAVSNILDSDIVTLYNSNVGQVEAESEITYILENLISDRYHISELIQNAIDNATWSFGNEVVNDSFTYVNWELSGVLQSIGESMSQVPIIGTIVNTVAGVLSAVTALPGIITGFASMASSILNTVGDLASGNFPSFMGTSLFSFEMDRGTGQYANSQAVLASNGNVMTGTSTSGSMSVASTTSGTVQNPSFTNNANVSSASAQTVTSASSSSTAHTIDDLYMELFEKQSRPIRVNLVSEDGTTSLGGILVSTVQDIDSRVSGTLTVKEEGSINSQLSQMRN